MSLVNSIMSEKSRQSTHSLAAPTGAPVMDSTSPQIESFIACPTIPSRAITGELVFGLLLVTAVVVGFQHCGRVCGMSRDFIFFLRFSPSFCIVDTLNVLSQLVYHTILEGPTSAVKLVASSREQHSMPLREFQNLAAHAFMSVVQAYMIYTLSHLPWTQFVILCYLSSYWTNFCLNHFGKPTSNFDNEKIDLPKEPINADQNMPTWTAMLAAAGQLAIWTFALFPILPQHVNNIFGEQMGTVLFAAGFLIACIPFMVVYPAAIMTAMFLDIAITLAPAGIMLYLCSLQPLSSWPSIVELTASLFGTTAEIAVIGWAGILASLWLLLHIHLYPFSIMAYVVDSIHHVLDSTPGSDVNRYITNLASCGVILVAILLAAALSYLSARILLFGNLADKLGLRHHRLASNMGWACMFLFVANLSIGWVYYTKVYDPACY